MYRIASEALLEVSDLQLMFELGRVIERLTQVPDYPGAPQRSERAAYYEWAVLREAAKRGLVQEEPGKWIIPGVGTLYEGPCYWEYEDVVGVSESE
jgi:hypothetical protein